MKRNFYINTIHVTFKGERTANYLEKIFVTKTNSLDDDKALKKLRLMAIEQIPHGEKIKWVRSDGIFGKGGVYGIIPVDNPKMEIYFSLADTEDLKNILNDENYYSTSITDD